MNISSSIKTVRNVITANSPVLLVGAAITGVVATGVLAAKGGYKARGIIDDYTVETGEKPDLQKQVKLTWLCYAPSALTGASTILSVVGVHAIHSKRHAALAGLYAVANSRLDTVQEKAEELLGPKKSQELTNQVAQEAVDKNPPVDHEVLITGQGKELCYDEWSGRYFMGSMSVIENAINEINRQLIDDGDASLNDFYDHLGLTPVEGGANHGWSGEKVTGRFGSTVSPDGRPAISIWFQQVPKPNLGRK